MSTLATHTDSTPTTTGNARTAVTAAGLAGALASAVALFGWFMVADPGKASTVRAPISVVECLIAGLAFVVLAVSLPVLAQHTRLPQWALSLAGIACAFIAIESWTAGTVIPHLANEVSSAQFDSLGEPTFLLVLLRLPMQIAGPIAFIALAVVGWRRDAMPRTACVLLALGGLTALIGDFPPVGLFAGVALAWTARSAKSLPRG